MTTTLTIPVEVRNPGAFLACCGLLELADRIQADGLPQPTGRFVKDGFEFCQLGERSSALLERLSRCQPLPGPSDEPGNSLAALHLPGLRLRLDWWREPNGQKEPFQKTVFKLWAGQQTSKGIFEVLQKAVATLLDESKIDDANPFLSRAALTGRFGFDPGAAWNALDAGFSPNEQGYSVASSPVTELLAAVGLQRFRPIPEADDRDVFRYVAWSSPLPAIAACAAAAGAVPDPKPRVLRFRIASRGSYRCFTSATEIARSS